MKRLILLFGLVVALFPTPSLAMTDGELVGHLRAVYQNWRQAMVRKDALAWKRYTSNVKQIKVRNRIWSERRRFPNAVFAAPMAPPSIAGLKMVSAQVKANTAKVSYFGKVDFGVGGAPTDNIFLVSYVREATGWKYHEGEFVKLDALPDVRKQLQKGDTTFVKGKDFAPSGVVERAPIAIPGPAKYIAKAYVYCPGREVKLVVNRISPHLYQNTKGAEVVIGGAKDGRNEVQFAIKDIAGGDPKAPLTIRIYLMSQVDGTKPIKALEYQIEDGSKPKGSGTLNFNLDAATARKLIGK